MSDYTTPSSQPGGSSSRGLFIARIVIVLFIVGLAAIGNNSGPATDGATEGAVGPAATDDTATAPATTTATE